MAAQPLVLGTADGLQRALRLLPSLPHQVVQRWGLKGCGLIKSVFIASSGTLGHTGLQVHGVEEYCEYDDNDCSEAWGTTALSCAKGLAV